MNLEAIEQIDQRKLEETRDGWRGHRFYSVTSQAVDVAVFGNGQPVSGLPRKGDAWDEVLAPNLVVVGRKFAREGGVDLDTLNRTGGYTLVEVIYETPGFGGGEPPPEAGRPFTRLAPSVSAVQVVYGIDPNTGEVTPGQPQIADGRGAGKDVGLLAYEVVVPKSPAGFAAMDIARHVALHGAQAANADSVQLPAYLESTRRDQFGPGQLRFSGFAVDDPSESGWRHVRYTLAAAPDFLARWTPEDVDGNAAGDERAVHIYQRMPFAGLFA